MTCYPLKGKPLSLVNRGALALFFTGVGFAFSRRHYQTNLLIIKGRDHLMIDFGTKTPQALYDLGLGPADVRNFLITHTHADHIGGLEEVMITARYITRRKPNIVINQTLQNLLWDMCLKGGSAFNDGRGEKTLGFNDFWNIIHPIWLSGYPRETLEAQVGSINIKLFRTKHIPDQAESWQTSLWSCGLIIDDRILYTSDTRYDPELIDSYSKRFDLEMIFHDCQFYSGGVHAGIRELKALAPGIKQKMILVHYGDDWEKFEDKIEKYGFKGLGKQWHFYEF